MTTLAAIKARTAARKAAGETRTHGTRKALPIIAACAHLGDRVPGQPCGVALNRCALHDCVTTRLRSCSGADRSCQTCPDHTARPKPEPEPVAESPPVAFDLGPLTWVSTSQLASDSVRLASMLPRDATGVVGIPRSGMIPASVIAAHLHLPLYELTHEGRLNRLGHGSRGRAGGFPAARGPLAVVDDTVFGGHAMRRARDAMARLKRPAVFACVYSRLKPLPESAGAVDVFAAALPSPHLLSWNLFNSSVLRGMTGAHSAPYYRDGIATDLDGVIVADAESGGTVGGPLMVPRMHPVPLIVTGRRERHRAATESQLRSIGALWDRLEMLPDDAPDDTPQTIAAHKARHYGGSNYGFFVESDPLQAELIAYLTKRPVICPILAKVF